LSQSGLRSRDESVFVVKGERRAEESAPRLLRVVLLEAELVEAVGGVMSVALLSRREGGGRCRKTGRKRMGGRARQRTY
jgi:hypothetical protein